MEGIKEKKRVHQGRNMRLARIWKNMTQEALADKLNLYQTDISTLEQKETIDDAMLERIAKEMNIPKDFLTDFDLDTTMQSYNVYENEFSMTQAENSKGEIMGQKIIENEENIYNPLDKVTQLYERLLKEKEQQIEELKTRLK